MSADHYHDARGTLCSAIHLLGCVRDKLDNDGQHEAAMALDSVVDLLNVADGKYGEALHDEGDENPPPLVPRDPTDRLAVAMKGEA